jgi:hypothetical protein
MTTIREIDTYTTGARIEVGDWVVCTAPDVTREGWDFGRILRLHQPGLHSGRIRVRWSGGDETEEPYLRLREWTPYTDRTSAQEFLTEALAR